MRRLFAVAAVLALCGCKPSQKPTSLRLDPALEALVPADSVMVVGADVESVRNTVVYQKLLSRVPLPQLESFAEKTGLDPRKDLSQLLSCSNGKQGVLLAKGKFNVKDLEARMMKQGAVPQAYKGRNLFGSGSTAIFFWNSSIAVAGSTDALHSIVDSNGAGGGMPASLRDLVRSIPAKNQIWAAVTGGIDSLSLPVPENSNLANVMQILKSIDNATIGMDLSSGLDLLADINCKTERDAKFVHDMVKGVVGIGRLRTPDNQPDLLKLYDGIQVTQQQLKAEVTAKIPMDLADKFLDLWLKH